MKTYAFELCEGRHYSPAKEGIFPKTITENGYDTAMLERRADERIPLDCERLELYTSGFVKAVLAVVKVCAKRGDSPHRVQLQPAVSYVC